jgi:hypothetical protein
LGILESRGRTDLGLVLLLLLFVAVGLDLATLDCQLCCDFFLSLFVTNPVCLFDLSMDGWMDGCREVFSPEIGSNTCASEFRSRVAEISCSPYSEIDQRPVGPRIHFTMEEFSSAIQYIATSFHSTHPWVFILRLVFFLITVLGT